MSKSARERSARERLAQERKRQVARAKRVRLLVTVCAAVAAVAVIVVGVVVFQANRGDGGLKGPSYAGPMAPIKVQGDGSIVMAQPNAKGPMVDLYEDLQCPICKRFEEKSGDTVKRLAAQGKIKVTYHLLGFVNPEGSVRAAAAGWCAADAGRYAQFHDVAYLNQPDERKALTIDRLKEFGKKAGLSGTFDSCTAGQKYAPQVKKNTEAGLNLLKQKFGGSSGTPSILVDGNAINQNLMFDAKALEDAILKVS